MIKTQIQCDKCGRQIEDPGSGFYSITVRERQLRTDGLIFTNDQRDLDMCCGCFREWWKQIGKEEPEEEPEEELTEPEEDPEEEKEEETEAPADPEPPEKKAERD